MERVRLFLSYILFSAGMLAILAGLILTLFGQGLWGAALCFMAMFLLLACDFSRGY